MYLKGLEIKGFKSFLKKTHITFPKGMISIVGPNGSGKSNILDAIRWVLGEQSIKSLRGEKLEDVIFAGTQTIGSVGYCEVTLIIDNEDRQVDIEYSELAIKRKAYRSGESQFYINGKRCRLKDIKEILLNTGIGKEGYSIISQGKIDEIINGNSSQKRALLEEASGISKYRYKKEESEKNLKVAQENLDRIEDVYIEIEKQIQPLRSQKEKAEKYIEYSKQLKVQEVNKILRTDSSLREELAKLDKSWGELEVQWQDTEKQMQEEREKIEINIQKNREEDKERQNLEKDKEGFLEKIRENTMQISLKEGGIKNLEETNLLLQEQISQEDIEAENIKIRLEELKLTEKEILLTQEKVRVEWAEKKKKIEEQDKDLQSLRLEIRQNQQKMRDIENERGKLETRLEFQDSNLKNFREKMEEYKKSATFYGEKKKKWEVLLAEKENEVERAEKKIGVYLAQIENNVKEIEAIEKEKFELYQTINKKNLILKDLHTKTNMLENLENEMQGFSKGSKAILKNKSLVGIEDIVANIIEVKPGYEKAIEQLLASRMENIVIEKASQSKAIIDYLKKEHLGRATFLPLDTIKGASLKYRDKGVKAIEVVEYDKRYEGIVSNLLGRMVIVDTMQEGLEISKKYGHSFRIATKTGEIFNVGGSITGGSSSYSKEIFTRRSSIQGNKEKIRDLEKDLQKIEEEKMHLEKEGENRQAKNKEESICLEKEKMVLSQIQAEKANIKAKWEQQIEQIRLLEEEKESVEQANLQAETAYKIDLEKIDALKKEGESLQTILLEQEEKNGQGEEEYRQLEEIINDLKREESIIQQKRKNAREQMENMQELVESRNRKAEYSKKKIEGNAQNIIEYKKYIEEYQKENVDIEKKVNIVQEQIQKSSGLQKEIQTCIALCEKRLKNLQDRRETLLSEKMKQDNEKGKLGYKIQLLEESLLENYRMGIEEARQFEDESVEVSGTMIKNLKDSIQSLGNVNLDAIAEFDLVNERYLFYKKQKEDLEESISKLNSIIRHLEKSMIEDFRENFAIISKNFNHIFRQLFGGGTGKLILVDEEDVLNSELEISVQPPGKKLKGISMLSGGEKALSAIALLFAIIVKKPVPFCILDEIDAPLDDANIYRYIQYLNTLLDITQFITITHRRGTMEASNYIYGVTMQEKGVSDIVSLKLEEAKCYIEE